MGDIRATGGRRAVRLVVATLLASLLVTVGMVAAPPAPSGADVVFTPPLPTAQDWRTWVNHYRATAGLGGVTEVPAWMADTAHHARYLVDWAGVETCNGFPHCETPSNPHFTAAGNLAAISSDITQSTSAMSHRQVVENVMTAPFHALRLLDPRLKRSAFGEYHNPASPKTFKHAALIDVLRGIDTTVPGNAGFTIFPADGTTPPLLSYRGNESPDPLVACAGYTAPTGLPVVVRFPSNLNPDLASATFTPAGGSPMESCLATAGDYPPGSVARTTLTNDRAAFLIPRTPLTPGVTYTYRITVGATVVTGRFTPYGQPSGATPNGATVGAGQVTLRWAPATSDGGLPITGYQVVAEPVAGGPVVTVNVGPGETAGTVTGLAPGTEYRLGVRALNAASEPTVPAAGSPFFTLTTPSVPAAPTAASAVAGAGGATVSWVAPPTPSPGSAPGAFPVTGYRVVASPGGAVVDVPAGTTSVVVPGLDPGVAYTFRVEARNAAGTGPRSAATAAVVPTPAPGAPGVPGSVSAVAGDGRATVTWAAAAPGASPVTSYEVVVSPTGQVVTVAPTATSVDVTGLANGALFTFTVRARSAAGAGPASAPTAPVMPSPPPGGYHPLVPARILDTRDGGSAARIAGGTSRELVVTGVGGVPASGVSAVVVNITATGPTAATHLTVFPHGQDVPLASTLNVPAGDTRPNLAVVKVGNGGRIRIFNNAGATHAVVDVLGWFDTGDAGGDRLVGADPQRILDTREASGAPALGPAATRRVPVRGVGGVPDDATAVVVNLTAVSPTAATHLVAWPTGVDMPTVSNVNLGPGQVRPNLAVVRLGADGAFDLFNNSGTVHVVVDVVGWFVPAAADDGGAGGAGEAGEAEAGADAGVADSVEGGLVAVPPHRLLDTRNGTGGPATPFGPGATRTLDVTGTGGVPPTGVTTVVLNVTAVSPSTTTHVWVAPTGGGEPDVSNLNATAGVVVANLVVVKVGADGNVRLHNHAGSTHLVADVVAWAN